MKFLSIIRSSEGQGEPPQALLDAMGPFVEASLADGSLAETGGLAPSASGARVRVAGGRLTTTDGPFSEAKEVVGGYAILEAPSREAALETTRRFLQLHVETWPEWVGECEVREIVFLAP